MNNLSTLSKINFCNQNYDILKENITKNIYYLAAAARRFLAFGAPGSAARDLEANNNLLLHVDVFLRLLTSWSWAALSLYLPASVKPLVWKSW